MTRMVRSPLAWLGGLLALYLFVPIVAFLIRLAGSGDRGFTAPGLWGALGTPVASATISTSIIALLGIPLAYVLSRSHGPFSKIVGVLVQLPLALPPVMSGIILIFIVGPYTPLGRLFNGQLTGTVTGIVIAQTFVASPFLIVAARSAFSAVDPALDEPAATLGHRPLARFWRVGLPVASSGIAAGLLLSWLRALGEYGATVLLSYHPYSLPVFTYVQFSSSGIPTTQAPTALALAIAIAAVGLGLVRRPRRRRPRRVVTPDPRPPGLDVPTTIAVDLNVTVGTFNLRLAYRSVSHRIAILGPSGSGKSVTLRTLAGLIGSASCAVSYNNESVRTIPTEARGIGYVPQGGILFPGRTVWQQVLFGVRADPRLAAWWLHTLQFDGLEERLPQELSGGQRQRVAIAQALSQDPGLVLLDEPFSALDAPVRDELRMEVRKLQHETGFSTVLVTHDPVEAGLLADEIIVVAHGRLLQSGPRSDVYGRPASPQVARLLGIHNLIPGTGVTPTTVTTGSVRLEIVRSPITAMTDVLWSIRPENVLFNPKGRYPAAVVDIADLGATMTAIVHLDGGPELRVRTTETIALRIGDPCRIDLDPNAISVWPR